MTDFFVRPVGAHSNTPDGLTYETAWLGWTTVQWGSGKVTAGSTLYVCGAHTYSEIIRPGASGSLGSLITIRGDYATEAGSITFSAGAYYFNIDKSYITLQSLTITSGNNRCIGVTGIPNIGFWLKNCTLSGSALQAVDLMPANTFAYKDVVIEGNTFNGGTGGAILWWVTSRVTTTLTNIQINNNAFNGVSGPRGVIVFNEQDFFYDDGITPWDGAKMEDVVISRNAFANCSGVAIECFCPAIYGRNSGIKVYDNTITNQQRVGLVGGGIVLGGFGLSATPDFGPNDVYNNKCYGLHGLSGLANIFYGTYRVFNNYAENLTTGGVDACGILFDHDCRDSVAFGNQIRDLYGNGSTNNSPPAGSGILILDATNCTAYGNLVVNCVTGVSFGNKEAAQSSNIFNNTFVNCSYAGAYMMSTADNTANVIRNNIFTTTTSSTPSVRANTASAWTGESNNCFYGFSGPVGHTLAASTLTADPDLNTVYRPEAASCIRTGAYLGGKDFYGKHFYNPPNIGAVDDNPVPAWLTAAEPV